MSEIISRILAKIGLQGTKKETKKTTEILNPANDFQKVAQVEKSEQWIQPPQTKKTLETKKWKTIRVFISSTFRDMHEERDHLVKMVFPELRERCAKKNLHLIDIDLRWGITEKEAEKGKVLEICLYEIEDSRPFFIGLLGERYGFIPNKLPEDVEFEHVWLRDYPNHSLTALEIIHGVLRTPDLAKRSFFYFRDPAFISQMPESKRDDFVAENEEASRKLNTLKDKIRASGRPVMENYPCHWDDNEGHLGDLDVFGQQVLEDMWESICEEYPEDALDPEHIVIERQLHEAFAEERSRLYIGRMEQAARLTRYVQGIDRRPVVVTGEPGCGKSAFLANWYGKYSFENPDDFVLAYFIGASPDSTNHYRLLRNICEELKRKFALKEEIPDDDKKLSDTMAMLLVSASKGIGRIVIMLDALDQLSTIENAHGLGWLLDYMPEKARLVVSSLEGDCLEVLLLRKAEEVMLPPLTVEEQRNITQNVLGELRRKLDEKQMAALLAHHGVKNPLFLHVALEELRLFGKFEQLTSRIKSLAEDIPGLFDQVLERLEEDHGRELVQEVFTLFACSRYGLSEVEMLDLLSIKERQFPRALWARLVRSTKSYIVQRGELICFFHRQLTDAVAARYLNQEKKHTKLAAYFEDAPLERKLDEYPYQLQHAEQWQKLANALSDLDFFSYAMNHGSKYEWMGYWRSLRGRFEAGTCYQAAINAKEKIADKNMMAHLLNGIGNFIGDMGSYPSAILFNEQARLIQEKNLGHDNPDVAMFQNNLAELYKYQGKYVEAEQLYKQALATMEKGISPDIQTPDLVKLLAYNSVETLFTGPEHPEVAKILNNLANIYKIQGKFTEAEPLYIRALAIQEKFYGSDHVDVAKSLNNFAGLYMMQKKFTEAERFIRRALTIMDKNLGHFHPDVAPSLNNLASLYCVQKNYPKAEENIKLALAIKEKTLGPNHPEVATYVNNLARLYMAQDKFTEAEPHYRRAVRIAEAALGYHHPETELFRDDLKAFENNILVSKRNISAAVGKKNISLSRDEIEVLLFKKMKELIEVGKKEGNLIPENIKLYEFALENRFIISTFLEDTSEDEAKQTLPNVMAAIIQKRPVDWKVAKYAIPASLCILKKNDISSVGVFAESTEIEAVIDIIKKIGGKIDHTKGIRICNIEIKEDMFKFIVLTQYDLEKLNDYDIINIKEVIEKNLIIIDRHVYSDMRASIFKFSDKITIHEEL